MKYRLFIGMLVFWVSILVSLPNVLGAAGPPFVWANQATLSTGSDCQDPENSGFTTTQVVVWEEHNGNNWDILMKYSLLDGALGSWIFSPVPPAFTSADETNPAVAVSRVHPNTGQEIHVVYQLDNVSSGNFEIWHTWTANLGVAWTAPVRLSSPSFDAVDPAIVYTEDLNVPAPGIPGMLMQIVWAEETNVGSGVHLIRYNAFYWNGLIAPPRGYVGPILIRNAPNGFTCAEPEIASVDENSPARMGAVDFDFSIVWEEVNMGTAIGHIWYHDGTTQTFPAIGTVLNPAGPGIISQVGSNNCRKPDIAATQNYAFGGETYYFHVDWVRTNLISGNFYIDSCYYIGPATLPGVAGFAIVATSAQGPTRWRLDRPTIASKLLAAAGVFETWMAWEDETNRSATNPDIWYTVGTCTIGGGFVYYGGGPPWRVPYVPGAGGGTRDWNPELWNRNDQIRLAPPLTHLVFDQDTGVSTPNWVEYIDP